MGKDYYSGIDDIDRSDKMQVRGGNKTRKVVKKRRKTTIKGR